MWADSLSDVDAVEAVEAARDHFRTSSEYLTPVHIIRYVRTKRVKETMSPGVPENCGRHVWTKDGTCANCLATNKTLAQHEWHAPGWGDGVFIDKPAYFDDMVAAANAATKLMIEQGYTYGDDATKDAAWHAADAVRRAAEAGEE